MIDKIQAWVSANPIKSKIIIYAIFVAVGFIAGLIVGC